MAGLLGALSAVYVPLEMRESVKAKATVMFLHGKQRDWIN